ncbi:LL-diaminopimelate aminotransferase [Heyndrickxia sporothermodurans]|uniref:Aminotransferase n=1 Tax=Heyndrickxia sporothermodurans TaxID=46224 RepID=A0A150KJR4_9BACI|nr:LL-diaminopimelate aminotransferase [Heyndrickxia sporothermodurans]KYC84162.1 Aspartate aminotransferase [Heyndrickxia sporothermodurans]MED3652597.1 LL-diaminopimelate aminotransferase [Heyndrickxia sporothermodurans]MED3697692.1 LL-diaminopimelate aminotransferase [Heyndrickxia sporothermodurans]
MSSLVSKRVQGLPPYLFSVIDEKKKRLQEKGVDVIDLGIGAPDLPTPNFIVERLIKELQDPQNFKYSGYSGCQEFREAVAAFYKKQYDVELDPTTEILTLIGSKEGIAHVIPAMIDIGDAVLIPDPGYPVYRTATYLAGGECIDLPLDPKNQYRPIFSQLSQSICEKAKLMFLNYPGNPTAATVDLDVFEEAVAFAKQHQIGVIHDSAYGLVTFDSFKAPSILQIDGAKDFAVEFGSLSKSFNMTGWRIGYVVGNREIIRALSKVKSNCDTSQFLPIQKAAAEALNSDYKTVEQNNAVYNERLEKMLDALKDIGIHVEKPKGSFFIWAPVPTGFTSQQFAEKVLEEAGVIITPGNAFGPSGEGYFRISLSVPTERLDEAVKRIKSLNLEVTKHVPNH